MLQRVGLYKVFSVVGFRVQGLIGFGAVGFWEFSLERHVRLSRGS